MLYFIPAWYHKEFRRENEQIWFQMKQQTEFDDTVKQIQLFDRNDICDYKILLFSFTPNLRHFLHRQGIFRAPYWSVFDAILEVERKKVRIFSFRDLKWPKNTKFIYTPFCVIAQVQQEKYAEIFFGEDGNMIAVHLFKDNEINRKNYYDDRGFLSNSVLYKDGKPYYEQYLDEQGHWKMCHFYEDGHVEINPKLNHFLINNERIRFSSLRYASLDDVVLEVFTAYYNNVIEKGIFCIAMHKQNDVLLESILKNQRKIISFYQNRYSVQNSDIIQNADYIVIDSQKYVADLPVIKTQSMKVMELSPFDARVDFGISSQLDVQNILIPVDELDLSVLKALVLELLHYLERNEKAIVHVFTRRPEPDRKEYLQSLIDEVYTSHMACAKGKTDVRTRFVYDQHIDEMGISTIIKEQRIVVDLSPYPDLYLQISCLSNGIPQIVNCPTQYVENGKNGIVVEGVDAVENALIYYLETLHNWNQAKIYSYELGKEFTSEKLIEKWKKMIKRVEND